MWLSMEPNLDIRDKLRKNGPQMISSLLPPTLRVSQHAGQASVKAILVLGICVHELSLLRP